MKWKFLRKYAGFSLTCVLLNLASAGKNHVNVFELYIYMDWENTIRMLNELITESVDGWFAEVKTSHYITLPEASLCFFSVQSVQNNNKQKTKGEMKNHCMACKLELTSVARETGVPAPPPPKKNQTKNNNPKTKLNKLVF